MRRCGKIVSKKGDDTMEKAKKISESLTEQVQIIMPEQINGFNRLFGGKLVEWMDVVAAVVARRHSDCNVTTASIDRLQFKAPAYVNDTMVLQGRITYVGNSSMEVRVDAYTEALGGHMHLVNTAYFIMVALDENEHPVRVPRLIYETEQEKREYKAGAMRQEYRRSTTVSE